MKTAASISGKKFNKPMTCNQSIKVRSLKDGHWYWIDQKILRLYGRELGVSGIAVYNVLACFADSRNQQCFPTRRKISQLLGVSQRTVTRKIKLLEKLDLVKAEKAGSSYRYLLIAPTVKVTKETSVADKRDTPQVTPEQTNNNQLINIINNTNDDNKKIPVFKRFWPKSREELLAYDLAEALDDQKGINTYLFYAKRYPEPLLRKTLGEVKEVPDKKIKKGRAALFHYLIKKTCPRNR